MGSGTAFNVYDDSLGDSLKTAPQSLPLAQLLEHPVGLRYFCLFLEPQVRIWQVLHLLECPMCSMHRVDLPLPFPLSRRVQLA